MNRRVFYEQARDLFVPSLGMESITIDFVADIGMSYFHIYIFIDELTVYITKNLVVMLNS